MASQVELSAIVPAERVDCLEEYFFETETIYWGIRQKEPEDPYEVFGFFPNETSADIELEVLRQKFPALPKNFERRTMEDSFWQNAYKEFVKPWNNRELHWIPIWDRDTIKAPEGTAIVYLDAGMAFGTGAHETTRLCARRLLDYLECQHSKPFDQIDLIDAGCGSGILALSAAALGFTKILGFDLDPEAIRVCHENAHENSHIPAVEFEIADLDKGLKNRQADFLMANIQTDVLISFSDPVVMGIRPGGTLALSGILTKELKEICSHYEARFAKLRPEDKIHFDTREDGDWADLLIQLNESARAPQQHTPFTPDNNCRRIHACRY